MRILIENLPWERHLTVNHCRMGPAGNWNLKDHVQAWSNRLWGEVLYAWAKLGYPPVQVPVIVEIYFRFPDEAERDPHNYFYVIANAVAMGLKLKNDSQVRMRTASVAIDPKNRGFDIVVTDEEA